MRTDYTEFEIATGRIRRHGICDLQYVPRPRDGNAIALAAGNPQTQRMEYDFLDSERRAINPRPVDLTPQEIESRRPPRPPAQDLRARITQAQWQAILARLEALEKAGQDLQAQDK